MPLEPHLSLPGWSVHRSTGTTTWLKGAPTDAAGRDLDVVEVSRTLDGASDPGSLLARWGGHWSLVRTGDSGALLAVDAIRSFPLFYETTASARVSDDVLCLADVDTSTVNRAAADEFLLATYVTGPETLYAGIAQVQAGELVQWRDGEVPTGRAYRRTAHDDSGPTEPAEADEVFRSVYHAALQRTLARHRGTQILVPLSGGLDSRLLLATLREFGRDDVLAFTYGLPDSREVEISRRIAESLGTPWRLVPQRPDDVQRAWASEEAGRYIRTAFAGASLPHVQDWYAVRALTRDGTAAPGALVLPGHTVVGNVHDQHLIDDPGPVPAERIRSAVVHEHFVLGAGPAAALARPYITDKVDAFLRDVDYDPLSGLSRADAIEYYNVHERQTKYINNSVRVYEFFGLAWELPMLDLPMHRLWESMSLDLTKDRQWYAGFVGREYARATGNPDDAVQGTFTALTLPAGRVAQVKRLLAAVRLDTAVERALSVRTGLNHPLSLQAYRSDIGRVGLAARLLRNPGMPGIYAEQFLAGTWAPGGRVLPIGWDQA